MYSVVVKGIAVRENKVVKLYLSARTRIVRNFEEERKKRIKPLSISVQMNSDEWTKIRDEQCVYKRIK